MTQPGEAPAFPIHANTAMSYAGMPAFGLTKRELFAAMALQALVDPETELRHLDAAAVFAVKAADTLLAALQDPRP